MRASKTLLFIALLLLMTSCSDSEPARTATKASKSSSMNISCFAYRDINRNGKYDMGDRPYAGLKVRLERPGDSDIYRDSNISGFTNFKMSLNNSNYPISVPGQYQINAESPEGWGITSNNGVQTLNIAEHQGAPADLIATQTLQPVGVAPELKIYGTLEMDIWKKNPSLKIIAQRPLAPPLEAKLDEDGSFSIVVDQGTWGITVSNDSGQHFSRSIEVNDYPVRLAGIRPHTDSVISGLEQKINFDDLTNSDTLFEIPNGYGGLDWRNWISTHHKLYKGDGYINGNTSGEYIAYNSSGHPAAIFSDQPFDLIQVYIGVAWPNAERGDIMVTAWRHDEIVFKDIFRAHTAGPILFNANYHGISRVEFSTEHYWQMVLDDLIISR